MDRTNLNIVGVNAYYENGIISTEKKHLKIAVLKVKYSDGSWDTIYRRLVNHKMSNLNNYIEEYKSIGLNQMKQLSNIVNNDEQKIFELYFKKYLRNDLNINISISISSYIENKKQYVTTKIKYAFHQFKNLRNIYLENVTLKIVK